MAARAQHRLATFHDNNQSHGHITMNPQQVVSLEARDIATRGVLTILRIIGRLKVYVDQDLDDGQN